MMDKIRERIFSLFNSIPVVRAVLFGSCVRNEAAAESNVDFFIGTGGRFRGPNYYGFCEELKERAEKPVDAD